MAFYGCTALASVRLPHSAVVLQDEAFGNCTALTSIWIPKDLTTDVYYFYDSNAPFYNSGLESIEFEEGTERIAGKLFRACRNLTSVEIPDSVTSIGDRAFQNCTGLTEINIPDSVTVVADHAFNGCTALASISLPESSFTICEGAFKGCTSLTAILIPKGIKTDISYNDDSPFNDSGLENVSFEEGIESVPNYLFRGCKEIKEIVIPDSVISIGERAFQDCTGLTEVYFPKSLTSIGNSAFSGCSSLDDIYFAGDAAEWLSISIGSNNDELSNKEIHFGTPLPDKQPPVAVIKHGELLIDVNDSIVLDAGYSTDNVGIMTYFWDLGDGSTDNAISISHKYSSAGTYTVTLTVTDYSGNVGTQTITVRVLDVENQGTAYTKLVFDICDSVSLNNIHGAQVALETENEQKILMTDRNGQAVFIVPNGSYNVTIWADNYFARTVTISANGGVQNCQIGLSGSNIMTGSVTVTELTWDEIVEAGIDTEDEDNQHVYKFETDFTFVAGIKDYEIPIFVYKNEAGEIVGSSGSERIYIEPDEPGYGGWNIMIYPITEKFVLVIYGEAHWLKEMYKAELVVNNNSNTDELLNVIATIDLPEGMSLAAMVSGQQSVTKELGTIGCSSSARTEWYLRGDKEGDYDISVGVSASTSFGEELHAVYTTAEPVHVYAGSALHIRIIADDIAERGKPYTVKYRLENVSDKSVYGLSFGLTGMEQYKVIGYGDKEAWIKLDDQDYGDAFTHEIHELAPGGYIEMELSTTIWFNSVLELIAFTELGSFVDVAYYLTDVSMVTLSGSTTEIPYDYELHHVERDHIISKIIKELYGVLYPDADVSWSLGGLLIELIGDAAGLEVPVIKGAKTLLKLQKGETDSRLVISIDDGRGAEDSIYNDVVRITSGTPGEAVIDVLNGTKIKCDPGEGKWLSIEARGPGSARIKVSIEDDYGRVKREYSFDYVVEDREISQKVTLSPDEVSSKTRVDENTLTQTIRRIRSDEQSAYESNPYMWFDSTLEFEIEGKTSDSNYSFILTKKQIKDLTDKTAVTNIKVEGRIAGMDLPREILESYAAQSDEECTVYARRLSDDEASELGLGGNTYQFMMTVGSDKIDSFGDQHVYITLPYELKENEKADDLIIRHIKADGTVEDLDAVYNDADKTISFSTPGFSYFQIAHKTPAVTGWQKIDGVWYFYDKDGSMATEWKQVSGKWYYFAQNGAMQTGWIKSGKVWYYLNPSGDMATGWKKISGIWYYFNTSGAMATGWKQISGKWYYFNTGGSMVTGWKQISGKWYYFSTSGAMVTGWQTISGKTYFFKSSGAMAANEWCQGWWLNANGTWTYKYKASWKQNKTGWWYEDTSGWYARNCTITIDGKAYTFDRRGYWVK